MFRDTDVSRGYVNNVNITNTTVNVTKVTNVYNTVIVNKSTTINNMTYVNQRVNNGVTVVSHDAFVNARPVAQNVMRVDERELASAPVSHMVDAEPVRTSVIGAGRPVNVRPPAAVTQPSGGCGAGRPRRFRVRSRPAAGAGWRTSERAVLVRPAGPTRPAQMNQEGRPQQRQDGFRSFTPPNGTNNNGGNNQVRQMPQTQPRTYEQQGNAATENRSAATENRDAATGEPDGRAAEPGGAGSAESNAADRTADFRESQQETRRTPQETHPLVRPTPPVQERTPQQEQQQEQKFNQWHEQRPASPPPAAPEQTTAVADRSRGRRSRRSDV